MFSILLKLKACMEKDREKRQRDKVNKAKQREKEGIATADDKQAINNGVRKASIFTRVLHKGAVALESIPVVLIVSRLLILLLIAAMVFAIVYSALSMVASSMVQTTLAEMTALDWSNPYLDSLKTEGYLEEDGTFRTLIHKIYQSPASDSNTEAGSGSSGEANGGTGKVEEIFDEIDLWCGLRDEDIVDYVLSKGSQFQDMNSYIYTFNILRTVRMAYRICYAEDSEGNRYIAGCEPDTLLGILFFEKGYDWMMLSNSPAWVSLSDGAEVEFNKGADGKINVSKDGSSLTCGNLSGYADYANVDDCYSTFFNTSDREDGPYSFSYDLANFNNNFLSAFGKNGAYSNLYAFLINEYRTDGYGDFSSVLSVTKEGEVGETIAKNVSLVKYLFPSMLMTAVNFDKYWDGNFDTKTGDICRYLKNGSEYFWNAVMTQPAVKSAGLDLDEFKNNGDIIGCLIAVHTGAKKPSEVSDRDRKAYTRQCINALYYNYHHIPYFGGIYDNVIFGAKEGVWGANSTRFEGVDWYACELALTFEAIWQAGGNINNYDCAALLPVENSEICLPANWIPMYATTKEGTQVQVNQMQVYKGGLGGEWFNGDIGNTSYRGKADFEKLISANTWCGEEMTFGFLRNSKTGTQLDHSVWYYCYNVENSDVIKSITGYTNGIMAPLSFAACSGGSSSTGNLHAMSVEGMMAVISGGDLIQQCFQALLDYGMTIGKTHQGASLGVDVTGEFGFEDWNKYITTGKYVELGGQGYILDKNGKFSDTETRALYFPLLDMQPKVEGVQNGLGASTILTTPTGYYPTGEEHSGIDFAVNDAADIYEELKTAHAAGRDGSRITQVFLRAGIANDQYTEAMKKYQKAVSEAKNLSESDNAYLSADYMSKRIPVVSIADGFITEIGYSCRGYEERTDVRARGNYVVVNTKIKGINNDKPIPITYCHLSIDSILLLEAALGTNGEDGGVWGITGDFSKVGGTVPDIVTLEHPIPIKQGTILGFMGNTGYSLGSHLHFGIDGVSGDADKGARSAFIFFGSLILKIPSDIYADYCPLSYGWFTAQASYIEPKAFNGYSRPNGYSWDAKDIIGLARKNTS